LEVAAEKPPRQLAPEHLPDAPFGLLPGLGVRRRQGQRVDSQSGTRGQGRCSRRQRQLALSAARQRRGGDLEPQPALALQDWALPYGAPAGTALRDKFPNLLLALKSKTIEPGLLAGKGGLTLEPIDQTADPRKTWQYNRGLRRILRLPNVAHDFPAFDTDNLRTVDEFDMFNGSPDYYDWRLLGKKELYIPYNAYALHSSEVRYDDIIRQHHINPELARYELHRVWVVEGTLKPGMKHSYSRRVFYLDEDSWQIALADNYDQPGKLWRTSEAHALNYYQVPVQWSTLEVYYDLKEQRYLVSGLDNQRTPYRFSDQADPREFSPNALSFYIR
jgi:hypothetical protein